MIAGATPPLSRLVSRTWISSSRSWFTPRPPIIVFLVLLALAPLVYIGLRATEAGRDIVYWDEFETALALVLRLDAGTTARAFLDDLFAVNNEHRMVTSRLLFAASYWLTGTVNFSAISLIGNASLLALCALLVVGARTTPRRLRLGLILALVVFQLENYENFLWSGSSIDHFQVVFLVGAAVTALAHGGRAAWLAAALCALLATLTLAHGLLVWPLGAVLLARAGGRRRLCAWCLLGALVAAGYAVGFSVNGAHRFAEFSPTAVMGVAYYWLMLLGTVPALGHSELAPCLGAVLLAALVWLGRRGAPRRETVAYPIAWFGVAALALVAIGRSEQVGGAVMSRYVVLSTLSWSLTAFMALERYSHPRRPLTALAACLPLLVAFNLGANRAYAASADAWLECRDRAATRFTQHGVDGRGVFALFPTPARSTELLNAAEQRGIYRLGETCPPRSFPAAQPSDRIRYSVDELTVNARSAFVRGWVVIPGLPSARGQIHLVLRSTVATHVFGTVSVQRPDVAQALGHPHWHRSGFQFARWRDRLPSGDYQLGFLVKDGARSEYIMTAHRLLLEAEGSAQLADRE